MTRETIFTLALLLLTSGCVAQKQQVESRRLPTRKDHSQIVLNTDQLLDRTGPLYLSYDLFYDELRVWRSGGSGST